MKNVKELAETNVGKLMLKYYIPAFIGVFLNALYNVVDRIFIGQGVSAEALSGVSVIFPVMLIVMGFGMMIGIGSGVLVSINLGKKDLKKAEQILGTGFVLMICISVVIMVVTYLLKVPILRSFGSTDTTFNYANDYLNIILAGTLFSVMGFSMNNIIRSEGNARIAMISMILSAGLNLLLDPLFIFVFGWGVKGAAWATIISMFALMVWVLIHFTGNKSVVKLRKEYIRFDFSIAKEIIGIGMAPFTMQIAGSFVQGLITRRLISIGGDLAAGSMGIINSVITLVIMVIVALNMASQPIIGFNYGAKANDRVKSAVKISLFFASVFSLTAFIAIESMPGSVIRLFNSDSPELFGIAKNGISLALLALPIVGFQVVASHFFQSIGKSNLSLFATLFRQVIILIPLLLILPVFWGINGIWLSFPLADTMSAVVVFSILIFQWKNLEKNAVPEYIETDNISDSFV